MVTEAIGAVTNAGFGIWNTLFQQSEQKKAREFQQGMALLSNQQQQQLNLQLLAATTDTERMAVLNNALAQIQIARLSGSGKSQSSALVAVAVVAVVFIIAVFALNKKQ